MGRKKLYHTDEERKEAKRRYEVKYLSKPGKKEKRYIANQNTQSERWRRWYEKNKDTQLAKSNMEKAEKLKRIPSWADLDVIKNFYINRPKGYHVDHIIPLRGKNVSGLHVIENLQYLPAKENMSKGNKYIA